MRFGVNRGRVLIVIRRIVWQIRRDRTTLGLMVVAPFFVTFLYAAMFTGTVSNIPTAVCIEDEPWELSLGHVIGQQLEQHKNASVVLRQRANAFSGFGETIQAVLIIPNNLTEDIIEGKNITIGLYVNATNELQANFILGVVANASSDAMTELFGKSGFAIDNNVTFQIPSPPIGVDLSFNISVVDEDRGFETIIGETFEEIISGDGNISLIVCDTREDIIGLIETGGVIAGVHIPENLTYTLLTGGEPNLEIFINSIESTEANVALGAIERAFSEAVQSVAGAESKITITYVYGSAGMSWIEVAGPTVIGFFSLFFSFIISGVFFLRERQQGTLERMLASPLTEVEIILGYAVAFVGFSMVQTVIIIGTILLYSPAILLEIGIVFLLVFILVFGSVTLAIAFSSRMKSELQVIQMIPLYIIPQLFFSGAFFSISFLPQILQFIPYLFPLTYYVQAVKTAIFFEASIVDILPHIIVLIFYASIGLLLAVTRGRR